MAEGDYYSEKMNSDEYKADTLKTLKRESHVIDPCIALKMGRSDNCLSELFESEETAYLAEYDTLEKEIAKQIEINDKDKFASFIDQNYYKLKVFSASEVLARLCQDCATACVDAFLDSQLRIYVDLNDIHDAMNPACLPLEHAARGLSYSLTHLLLCRGAFPDDKGLKEALIGFRFHDYVVRWIDRNRNRKQSYFKLTELFGSPELEEPLNVIKLLASYAEQLKICNLCLECIEIGNIIELGALLFVCWDRLLVPSPDLENTPIVQFIMTELESQTELYMDEENFVNAFNVIRILRLQKMLKHDAPRGITYAGPWGVSNEITECENHDWKLVHFVCEYDAPIWIDQVCFSSSRLSLKVVVDKSDMPSNAIASILSALSRKIFSNKQMLSRPTSSHSNVGVQTDFSQQIVPPKHPSPQQLAIKLEKSVANQISKTTSMRSLLPLFRIAKRIIK